MYSVKGSCFSSAGFMGYCGGLAAKLFKEVSERASILAK